MEALKAGEEAKNPSDTGRPKGEGLFGKLIHGKRRRSMGLLSILRKVRMVNGDGHLTF